MNARQRLEMSLEEDPSLLRRMLDILVEENEGRNFIKSLKTAQAMREISVKAKRFTGFTRKQQDYVRSVVLKHASDIALVFYASPKMISIVSSESKVDASKNPVVTVNTASASNDLWGAF